MRTTSVVTIVFALCCTLAPACTPVPSAPSATVSPPPVPTSPPAPVPTSPPSPPSPIASPTPPPPAAPDAGAPPPIASDAADPPFRSCAADADCVAVERVGCCKNGRKVAVAVAKRDAYLKSFSCDQPHPICPAYRLLDERVPFCDTAAHLCAMKSP